MNQNDPFIPFSQRNGLSPIPSQLKIGQISAELRRLISYYISEEIDRGTKFGYDSRYFTDSWKKVAKDLHVLFFGQDLSTYKYSVYNTEENLKAVVSKKGIGEVFDLVEFLFRHTGSSNIMRRELTGAFVRARAAYRIVDDQIVAVGTAQQGAAFESAVQKTEEVGAEAARAHLISAGIGLRDGDWAGSVRESIHAVEAMARRLEPEATKLGSALATLEKKGKLHRSLKSALGSLYGYTSDQEGVRHALVFDKEANVDEADALFMLGACASFVSYMIARDVPDSQMRELMAEPDCIEKAADNFRSHEWCNPDHVSFGDKKGFSDAIERRYRDLVRHISCGAETPLRSQ